MAIIYTSKPNVNRLINVFNNNVFEFADNGAKTAKKCMVLINNTFSLTRTPINNNFHFNLKEIASLISKQDNWQDKTANVLGVSLDEEIITSLIIKFTIEFTDDTTVLNETTYTVLRSVSQINNVIDIEKTTNSNNFVSLNNLTFFKGYPFDFTYYSNTVRLGTLSNVSTDFSKDYNFVVGSNRIFLSNNIGDLLQDDESDNILKIGLNLLNVALRIPLAPAKTINLKLVDSCTGGIYLKYINEFGSWSYWLFNSIYTSTINARIKDEFNVDFKDITATSESTLITGKDATETLNLTSKNLDTNEVAQLESILTSPRVELYNGTVDSVALWQTVIVNGGSFTWTNTKRDLANISIQVLKNKYTQV
jgi:hypothetical protein